MLIFVAVSIQVLINSGLLSSAGQAGKSYQAAIEEEANMGKINIAGTEYNSIDEYLRIQEQIIQNIGKEVPLKPGWGTEEDSSVYAVSVGNGEVVPVPKDFYYVGGNLSTGVIISDDEADKYDGKTDKTTYEYTSNLKGNQFVWIPCSVNEYHKTDWKMQTADWENTTPDIEKTQIQKYGGFYVARYEAGLATTIPEFTKTQNSYGSSQVYNKEGKPQSKAGIIPWNFVDWTHSKANSESMYKTDYVSSGLITGTQWDVILNKIVEKTDLEIDDLKSSSKWGNYRDTKIDYKGRMAQGYVNSYWYLNPFGAVTTGTTKSYAAEGNGELLTTGASSITEKYHIYDVAGNVYEWTEEESYPTTSGQHQVMRGGSYSGGYEKWPACLRNAKNAINLTCGDTGFRVVLYIK